MEILGWAFLALIAILALVCSLIWLIGRLAPPHLGWPQKRLFASHRPIYPPR